MAGMKQTPLHHCANPDLLALMPAAARVVEAGCSSGALAEAYKQRQPNCRYLGIEIDPSYGLIAQNHLDHVLVADLDGLCQLSPPRSLQADLWVFGDCLEHLHDPWRVLRWVHQLQPPNGVICACIPNAQHWSVQGRLSVGAFHYEDAGLLDRTHLRWFTRATIQGLFEQAGYTLTTLQARVMPQAAPEALLDAIRRMASACGGDPDQAEADAQAFQFVLVAKRKPHRPLAR